MQFDLIRPCASCPFRSDRPFFLSVERAEEIADALLHDRTFACHKTVDYSGDDGGRVVRKSQHCAGALIILEKLEQPSQLMRIGERLGIYDRHKLDMAAPVPDDFEEWIDAQEG